MKFTFALSALFVLLPLFVSATPLTSEIEARHHGRQRNGGKPPFGGNGNGKNGNNAGGNNSNKGASSTAAAGNGKSTGSAVASESAAATTSSAAAAATSSAAATGQPIVGAGNADDAQKSLTLDPGVIMKGLEQDGQETPEAGQVPSATSGNNFINFCLTQPSLPLTNGQQVTTGSCNQTPMGVIIAQAKMPSSKFVSPTNGDNIAENTAFTIKMAVSNMETGNFVNAAANYYAAPQQINGQGLVVAHSHVVVEAVSSMTQTTTTDPTKFAFFKGLNAAAVGGVLTADVTNGLPAGTYRLASINTAANHQPVLVAVAQHGSLDDQVYFTVGGAGSSNSTAGAATGSQAASSAIASSTAASSTAAGGKKGGKNGTGGAQSTTASTPASTDTAAAGNNTDASSVSSSAAATSTSTAGNKNGQGNNGAGKNGQQGNGRGQGRGRNGRALSSRNA